LAAVVASAAELWVAPSGSDANPGTREKPLASVAVAQRKARELRRIASPAVEQGLRIVLRGGTYVLTEPLYFRAEDAGREGSPTWVEAAPGEQPVLSGGVAITGWKPASEAPAGLPAVARGKVWEAPSPVVAGRVLEFRQLWVGAAKAVRARTPNAEAMEKLTAWDVAKREAGFPEALVAGLGSPAGVELVLEQQWEIAVLRLKTLRVEAGQARVSFLEPESRIEFEHPWPQPILAPKGAGAFYLVNAGEFLDQPGEWYHDAARGRVYYWPREGEDLGSLAVVAPVLENLLRIEGTADQPVRGLGFRGLGFSHATWLRPSLLGHVPLQAGMYLKDGYSIRPVGTPDAPKLDNQAWIGRPAAAVSALHTRGLVFERCRFERLGMSGLDLGVGSQGARVEGCVFRDLGGNGLQAGSFQDGAVETHVPYNPSDARELCSGLRIANNCVEDAANEDWGCVGILAGYVRDTVIEHNEVSKVSYTAISLGWGWTRKLNCMRNNRVHGNQLHHYATRLCDTAGVYTLSAQPGTVVDENWIHGVTMSPYVDRPEHWFYLYTDEGSAYLTVRDNALEADRVFKNANGPNNVWERNGPEVPETIRKAAGLEPAWR
jgi:hypothetical protein